MKSREHITDVLFLLTLFGVLAASSLLVVMMGANVYRQTASELDEHFLTRTPLAYVAAKVRQHDMTGAVYVTELENTAALVLEDTFGEYVYQTWIYYDEGSLKEIFLQKGEEVKKSFGLAIMETPAFLIETPAEGLLRFTAGIADSEISLDLSLRTGAD
jgi:hypothetical protein